MKRSILLPAIGDPYLLSLWLFLYKRFFLNEVDEVVVCLDSKNGSAELNELNEYLVKWLSKQPKTRAFISKKVGIVGTFETVLSECRGDVFSIVQEDAFIFKTGQLDYYFKMIENGETDIIGTPMYCYSASLIEQVSKYVPKNLHEFLKNMGLSLWQNFLFAKYSSFLETDREITPTNYDEGQKVPFLDEPLDSFAVVDLLASVVFQWRKLGKRFFYVDQNLSTDIGHMRFFNAPNYWLHVNCLSNVIVSLLSSDEQATVDEATRAEYERRISWWTFAQSMTPDDLILPDGFEQRYNGVVDNYKKTYLTDQSKIDRRVENISKLLY